MRAMVEAIERSMAVIEFSLDGTVQRTNENFLRTLGYSSGQDIGQDITGCSAPATLRACSEYAD